MTKQEKESYNKQKVLNVISQSSLPVDIQTIRTKSGLKAWIQCKAICMELMAEKKILGQKTTNGWFFVANSSQLPETNAKLGVNA